VEAKHTPIFSEIYGGFLPLYHKENLSQNEEQLSKDRVVVTHCQYL
jgi:hypothetical protein